MQQRLPNKNVRDATCQTDLQLPVHLPKEIEDLLLPYFTYANVNQQQSPAKTIHNCDRRSFGAVAAAAAAAEADAIDHDARNESLCRKLFATDRHSNASEGAVDMKYSFSSWSPPPASPILVCKIFWGKETTH